MAELLRMENICAGYGDAVVLDNVSLTLNKGDSLALLGRNGMGKTTLLATLMGATNLRSGKIFFADKDISTMPSHLRARLGLGWVSQERDIFKSLTVEENLLVVQRSGYWDLKKVYGLFPRLEERKANMGDQLSGGEQQMLSMGRALMINPKVLLLDEPLEGLAPLIVQELLSIISKMVEAGDMAVVLVEQHARQILPITKQALILERGSVVYAGKSDELLAQSDIIDRWLGAGSSGADSKSVDSDGSVDNYASNKQIIPAIDAIQVEHRAIAAILKGLSKIINMIETEQIEPDFKLLASMIEYIAEMPDKLHHPKEDQIFALLRKYTNELDPYLDKLEQQHKDTNHSTSLLDRALVAYVQGGASEFPQFKAAVNNYIKEEWDHLGTEERHILPAARKHFTADDWLKINDDFAKNGDPWSGPNNRYADIFKRITNLLPENMV